MSFVYIKNQINDNVDNKWTEHEDNQLLNELNKNININQIILNHKRPDNEVKDRIYKIMNNILSTNNYKMQLFYNIIDNIKISDGKINNTKWTENEDKKLIEEVSNNMTIEEIIKIHNRSNIDIKNRLIRLIAIIKDKNEKKYKEYSKILNLELEEFYKLENIAIKQKIVKTFNKI